MQSLDASFLRQADEDSSHNEYKQHCTSCAWLQPSIQVHPQKGAFLQDPWYGDEYSRELGASLEGGRVATGPLSNLRNVGSYGAKMQSGRTLTSKAFLSFVLLGVALSASAFFVPKDLSNRHFRFKHMGSEPNFTHKFERALWTPVAGCELPPQKPFYLDAGFSFSQALFVALVFGSVNHDAWEEDVAMWRWAVLWVVSLYQFSISFLSLALCLQKYSRQGPFNSHWDSYECLGAMLIDGPWFSGLLNLCGQMYFTRNKLSQTFLWAQAQTELSPPEFKARWNVGGAKFTEIKVTLLRALVCCKIFFCGLMLTPFFCTHLAFGFVAFLPVTVGVLSLGLFLSFKLGMAWVIEQTGLRQHVHEIQNVRSEQRAQQERVARVSRVSFGRRCATFAAHSAFPKAALLRSSAEKRSQYSMVCMSPLIFSVSMAAQVSYYQMLYWRRGLPWTSSVLVAWSERPTSIYMTHFEEVLRESWTLLQLIEQAF